MDLGSIQCVRGYIDMCETPGFIANELLEVGHDLTATHAREFRAPKLLTAQIIILNHRLITDDDITLLPAMKGKIHWME